MRIAPSFPRSGRPAPPPERARPSTERSPAPPPGGARPSTERSPAPAGRAGRAGEARGGRPHRAATLGAALAVLLAVVAAPAADAAGPPEAEAVTAGVRAWRQAHETAVVTELAELLALPNVASNLDDIRRNAALLQEMLERRGIASRLLSAGEGTPPAVYGELSAPGAEKTVVFYAHYDGQPVDLDRWTGSQPWDPVMRDGPLEAGGGVRPLTGPYGPEWRLYARSASDDKSPIVAMLAALDALAAAGIPPSVNLKFFFEGEEEAGSDHLAELLVRHADTLSADAWIFCDGPVHQTRRPVVVFGARGVMSLAIIVYGPARELHSGHYGNWAPNPAAILVDLLAGMRSPDGRILIPGFYDDVAPLSDADRQAVAAAPDVETLLLEELALADDEAGGSRLGERILLPALNVKGLAAGGVGAQARNAIPTQARASIGFRLVPDQTPEGVRQRVEAHLRQRGYYVVHEEPDLATRRAHSPVVRLGWGQGYPAMRTPLDSPVSRAVLQVVDEATADPVVVIPSYGGSLPMYVFKETLRAPLVIVPMVNHDNNQHAPNENLRLENLWDGIEIYGGLIARLGGVWQGSE